MSLKIDDIDSERTVIRVEQYKDRYVLLSRHLLELLRAWCKQGARRTDEPSRIDVGEEPDYIVSASICSYRENQPRPTSTG